MSISPAHLAGLFPVAIIIGFHGRAIYVSFTFKELKKVRFLRLALFLSLSDFAIGIEYVYGFLLHQLNNEREAVRFQCMMIKAIISGSILSSLLQTLIICLERLNATFTTQRRILKTLTSNVSVGLCFFIPHCYTMVKFAIQAVDSLGSCDSQYTVGPLIFLTHDVPVVLIITAIAVIYGVVAKRMVNQKKTMEFQGTNLTESQIEKNKIAALRMRKNVATLGMIIIVAVLSAFPRGMIGLYAYAFDSYDTVEPYLLFSNNVLLLLTPVLDPFIYLFRIQKYRQQLICKCCVRSNAIADSGE